MANTGSAMNGNWLGGDACIQCFACAGKRLLRQVCNNRPGIQLQVLVVAQIAFLGAPTTAPRKVCACT